MEELAQRDERLQDLEKVDKEIIQIIATAGSIMTELSKEKPALKTAENHVSNFIKTLETVDKILTQQMAHLGQTSNAGSHEGTHYDCAKEREIMLRCSEDLKERLDILADERAKYLTAMTNERPYVVDVDDEMDRLEAAEGVDR